MLVHVLMKVLPDLAEQVWEPLLEVHAWLRFLPEQERPTFLREFHGDGGRLRSSRQ